MAPAVGEGAVDYEKDPRVDAIVDDPHGLITGGKDNATARTIAYWEGDPVDEPPIIEFLRQIIANKRAGGWRKVKSRR